MSINNNIINVGANIDSMWNITAISYENYEEKWKVDIILWLSEDEIKKLKNQNTDYLEIFTELSNKYKSEILSKLKKNNYEEKEWEINEQVSNFLDKIRKILSKNIITRSLTTSES